MSIDDLLLKLSREGGYIVSSGDCSELEIAEARACDRFAILTGYSFGYVLRAPLKPGYVLRTPLTPAVHDVSGAQAVQTRPDTPQIHAEDRQAEQELAAEHAQAAAIEARVRYVSTENYLLGQAVAHEETAKALRVKSGELFAVDNDDHARVYRRLAKEVSETAEDCRKRHTQHMRTAVKL